MEARKDRYMSKFAGITIEQDPKCDTRFRITMHEDAVDKNSLFDGITMRAIDITGIHGSLEFSRRIKNAIRDRAAVMLWDTEVYRWIKEHGGRKTICHYAAQHKGDQVNVVYMQKGQPAPHIINNHYRVGISITFKERDKAMLFKMRWMDQPIALAA